MTTVLPELSALFPHPVTIFGFYKGTRSFPPPPELMKLVFSEGIAEELKVLTKGGSDTDAKKIVTLKGYLDALEDELDKDDKRDPDSAGTAVDPFEFMARVWGPRWQTHWYRWHTCIGALLQLGGIKNDENNGWQVVQQIKGGWDVSQ